MAISWGSWAGPSGQRLRVGIDLSVSSTTITAKYYIEAESSMNDTQTMTLTGASTGTVTYTANTPQSGGTQLVTTKTKSGTRGSKYTFGAKVTGVYTGASPSESASITVPAAPPAKPSTPSVSSVKSSSFKATLGSAPSTNGASITGYVFQISTASDFTAGLSTISTGASTLSATFTGLAANTDYWVRVKATSGAGDSSYSSGRAVTTTPNAPAAPTSPTVTRVSDTTQNVGWSRAATSAAPYVNQYVERRDNVATAWIRASGALAGTATAFTDTTTVANRRYDYRVVAENAGGTGTSSVVSINTTPAAPTGVTAVKVGATIEVSWTLQATQAGITAHEVWDKPAGGVGVLAATVAGTATAWTDATPDTSKTHQYYVIAKAGALASAASTPSNVVQLLAPPLAPSRGGPTGAVDRAKAVAFAWKHEAVDTTAQSAYELQYRVNGGSWVVLTGTTAQTRSVTALGVSGTVEWQVRTKGQHASFGPWSAVWTFTLASQPTVLVSTPSGVYGSSRLTVVWAYANVDASGQASFEAELRRDGALLESRTGSSGAGSAAFTSSLADRVGYSVRVRVRSGSGLWSDWASMDFTTAFPLPVSVTPIPEWDVETGSVSLTFTAPDTPETYAWTGAPHASTSTKTKDGVTLTNLATHGSFESASGTVEIRRNKVLDPSHESGFTGRFTAFSNTTLANVVASTEGLSVPAGSRILKVTTTAAQGGVTLNVASANPGAEIVTRLTEHRARASLYMLAGESYRYRIVEYRLDAVGGVVSSTAYKNAVAPGGWVQVAETITPVELNTILRLEIQSTSPSATFYTDAWALEETQLHVFFGSSYFDGSFAVQEIADLVVAWAGAVNASPSVLVGKRVVGESHANLDRRRVYQSGEWSASGSNSAAVVPLTGNAYFDYSLSGLTVGQKYTVAAWAFLPSALNGSPATSDALGAQVTGSALATDFTYLARPDNSTGEHLLRATFTAAASTHQVRLMHGYMGSTRLVFWDALTIAEGVHPDLMPFDGDTQSTTDVETITVQRQIGDSTWVTIASDIQPDSAITDPLPSLDGTTYYRALSKSADTDAPGPEVQAVWERPLGGTHFYLNAGDGFLTVAHAPGHQTDDQLVIEQSSHQFAGRPDPVVFYGEHETYTVPFTGPLVDTATPRQAWLQLLRERGIVCYRDSLGRRVFGTLTLQLPTASGLTTVQGSITQVDYTEGAAA